MKLDWKEFKVHLPSMKKFLDENVPEANGIVANSQSLVIVEETPLPQAKSEAIVSYYNALSVASEQAKFNRDTKLPAAIVASKQAMLNLEWNQLTTTQRKIIFGLELDESEIDTVIATYT